MSLDAIHADGIEEGLQRWAANPGPAPEQSFRVTSFFGAGLKGFPSAGFEVGGSVSDVLSAFGTAAAASGGSAGGMFSLPTPEEQKQEEEARQRMLSGNVDLGAGTALRRKANEFAPDPLTSHQADQVMHGVVRFGAKAVSDVMLFGPFMGATVLGLEEGNTVTQNLRAEGVDTGTAVKVGAVQGAISAAGAVMPVAGRTVMQTLGLVGVGGPGSYMAQEALSKKILEQAGYQDQASLHNPFDPLGLALSTIIPGGFGAFHLRGQFRQQAALKAAVQEKSAFQSTPIETALQGVKLGDYTDPVATGIIDSKDFGALKQTLDASGIKTGRVLGNGFSSVVLETSDGNVLRLGSIANAPIFTPPKSEHILQPIKSGTKGELRWEVYPKADTSNISLDDVVTLKLALRKDGWEFEDSTVDNVGRVNGKLVVIDPGAVEPGDIKAMSPQALRGLKYDDPRLDAYAARSAEAHGVPPALLLAIKNAGEKSGPTATSPKGAQGVMQFMPGTAKEMGLADRTDPIASIDAGARYLKKLYDAYGSWDAAVAHYNGGGAQAAIVRGGGRPTAKETIGYLDRVQKYVAEHTASEAAGKPEAVDAARVAALNDTVQRSLPDTPDAVEKVQRAADVVAESGGRAAEAEIPAVRDFEAEMGALREQIVAQSNEVARLQAEGTVPPDARTITNKSGDVFYDTRGTGERFHGTSRELDALSDDYALAGDNRNIYGQGFYTTDAADISNGYMKKGRGGNPALYKVTEKNAPKLFDMEAPLTPELKAKAEEILGPLYRETDVDGKEITTLRELYDEARAESQGEGYSRDDVQEMFDSFRHYLEGQGYDGFTHVGGLKTGNRAHGVNIYWTPEKHVQIEKADIGAYRAPKLDAEALAQAVARANELSRRLVEVKAEAEAFKTATEREADNSLPDPASVKLAGDEPAKAGAELGSEPAKGGAGAAAESAKPAADGDAKAADAGTQSLDTTLAQKLATEQPDLQVILPGTDTPISVKDAMARIAEEQKQDVQWAELVRTAAECALTAA